MKRTTLAVGVLLLTVFAVGPTASAKSGDYIGGTGDVVVDCTFEPFSGACLGGNIFTVPSSSSQVDIEIDDDLEANNPTGGYYQHRNETGAIIAKGGFCGSLTNLAAPSNATELTVFVDTALAPFDCPTNPAGVATTGTIVATFS